MKIVVFLRAQILLLALFLLLWTLSALNITPSTARMTDYLRELFAAHGMLSVGVISFIENIIGINVFFPGSIVILLAMAMTAGDPQRALLTFVFIYIPSIVAHNVNYMLGRMGYKVSSEAHADNMEVKPTKGIAYLFTVTFWHPHFTALSCLASGAEGVLYRRFLGWFLVISFPWNVFWAVVMYNVGLASGSEFDFMPFMIGYVIIWGGYDYFRHMRSDRNRVEVNDERP